MLFPKFSLLFDTTIVVYSKFYNEVLRSAGESCDICPGILYLCIIKHLSGAGSFGAKEFRLVLSEYDKVMGSIFGNDYKPILEIPNILDGIIICFIKTGMVLELEKGTFSKLKVSQGGVQTLVNVSPTKIIWEY